MTKPSIRTQGLGYLGLGYWGLGYLGLGYWGLGGRALGACGLCGVAIWMVACAPKAVVPSSSHEPKHAAAPRHEPRDQMGWARARSTRFALSFPLPQRSLWKQDPAGAGAHFFSMSHAKQPSTLIVGLWTEDDVMSAKRCERRARLWRSFPDGASVVEKTTMVGPGDFHSHVEVGLQKKTLDRGLLGYVLAFGAAGVRCFAFAYRTEAAGDNAERLVAERLADMAHRSLAGVRIESSLQPPPRQSHPRPSPRRP